MTDSLQAAVEQVIDTRYSCRAFTASPVSRDTLEDLLRLAARAPSGTNTQPWKTWVVTGDSKARLSERLLAAFDDPEEAATHSDPYPYYPRQWVSPYLERRRQVGFELYALLGIQKGDAQRMHAQHARNYRFFDAPVALIFTLDTVMEQGSWLDYGMFLQTLMLAARARGLDTCPQVSVIHFHRIIREHLAIPETEMLICGMALGHADPDAPENRLRTPRAPLDEWVHFVS